MNNIIIPVLVLGAISLFLGAGLELASKYFVVQKDEKTETIKECLPGANCGGCGYAGCAAYAEAIAKGKAAPNLCAVCTEENLKKICGLIGKNVSASAPQKAYVSCRGTCEAVSLKYEYYGIDDCFAASLVAKGQKECNYGCLGFGTCVGFCVRNAICVKDGVAVIDEDLCVGCGACVKKCPRGVIKLRPQNIKTEVLCVSKDKGANVRAYCKNGCIGCSICQKTCTKGAITIQDNVAVINYDLCNGCAECVEKCPVKCIKISDLPDKEKADEELLKV